MTSLAGKYHKFLILTLVTVGVVLRFYYFYYPLNKSSEITVDEAVYGLQAERILGGDRPVFYPAQDYTGSFSGYISAAIFSVFGVSAWGLKLVPLLFSMGTPWLIYLIALKTFSRRVAFFTLFVSSLGTPFWNNWSSRAGTGYVEATFIGALLLLLVIKLTKEESAQKIKIIYFTTIGFLSGLGFWIQPTIVYFVLPSLIYLLMRLRKDFFKFLVFFVPSFLIGAAPVIYYNLAIKTSGTASALLKWPWGIRGSFLKLVFEGFPVLLGGRTSNSHADFNLLISGFIYLFFIISLIYFFRLVFDGRTRRPGSELIVLTFIITLGIFLISTPFNQFSIEPRYLYGLYAVLPIIIGVFLDRVSTISVYLFAFVILIYGINSWLGLTKAPPLTFLDTYNVKSLVSFFRQKKIDYAVATPSLGHRLAFFSGGKIKAAVRGGGITEVRFEKDNFEVTRVRDADPRLVAYVGLKNEPEIKAMRDEAKAQLGDYFSETLVNNNFVVYYAKAQK